MRYLYFVLLLFIISCCDNNTSIKSYFPGAGSGAIQVAVLQHQEFASLGGDTLDANGAWVTRKITNELHDDVGISIIGDTSFSLPQGKYLINYTATCYVATDSKGGVRLYNQSTDLPIGHAVQFAYGTSIPNPTNPGGETSILFAPSLESITFTPSGSAVALLDSTSVIKFQHAVSSSAGMATGAPLYPSIDVNKEVYSEITILKIG